MKKLMAVCLFVALTMPGLAVGKPRPKTVTTTIQLHGLSTRASAKSLRTLKRKIWRVKGVKKARADLGTGELIVRHARWMPKKKIVRAARRAGFEIRVPESLAKR